MILREINWGEAQSGERHGLAFLKATLPREGEAEATHPKSTLSEVRL